MSFPVTFYRLFLSTCRCEAERCVQVKLLKSAIFAESWIELQQPLICSLAQYAVLCVWSGLHRLSPSSLDALTWNFNHTEIEPEGRLEKSWRGIISLHNIGRFREPVFRASSLCQYLSCFGCYVDKVMATAVYGCEQIVWAGKIWYVSASEILGSLPEVRIPLLMDHYKTNLIHEVQTNINIWSFIRLICFGTSVPTSEGSYISN